MFKKSIIILLLLLPAIANAQHAVLYKLPNGNYTGFVYDDSGKSMSITDAKIIDLSVNPTQPPVTTKADQVVYVFEKDMTVVPKPVALAIRNLNTQGIVATTFENDTTTGLGGIPLKDSEAVKAARATGLPCLVVLSKGKVLRVIKNPKEEKEVMEAVK